MKNIVYFILSLVALSIQANAQHLKVQEQVNATVPSSFVNVKLFSSKEVTASKAGLLREYVRSFSLLETDHFTLNKIVADKPAALEVDVPFNGEVITLQLITSSVVNERTAFFSRNNKGKTRVNYDQGAYYYGVIKGQPNTLVAISFFTGNVIGVIANENGNYVIGKSNKSNYNSNEYILYNDKDLLIENTAQCGTKEETSDSPVVIPRQEQKAAGSCDRSVSVYIETDYQVYLNQGSNEFSAINFATGLFNVTATLYQNELIQTFISELNVWTVADPYMNGADNDLVLALFQNEMSGGFNGDLAHLFSGRSIEGGKASGYGVLCENANLRTAVSGDLDNIIFGFPTYSWNAHIVTHEMGHCLGSRHTHACVWNGNNTAIDGCYTTEGGCSDPGLPAGGTIMSYCHFEEEIGIDFNLGFGPQPGDVIRDHVNNAPCLPECCPSNVAITGFYDTPITESSNWIVSSGQTTISYTDNVRLDANPLTGYIELRAFGSNDFFSAQSVSNGAFVAEALDGCDGLIPYKLGSSSDDFVDNNTSAIREETVLTGLLLEQNIPNPFGEKTIIKAFIPDEVLHAEINIYSLYGLQLENYTINERGGVAIEILGGNFAPGVYLYTLIADGQNIDTKKMILSK